MRKFVLIALLIATPLQGGTVQSGGSAAALLPHRRDHRRRGGDPFLTDFVDRFGLDVRFGDS